LVWQDPGHDAPSAIIDTETEAILLGPPSSEPSATSAGLEAAIRCGSSTPITQTIDQQSACGAFGSPSLPTGCRRGLIETERRRRRCAIVAGNLDHIGIGLATPGRQWWPIPISRRSFTDTWGG